MIDLLLSGMLLFPTPQADPIPVPKPKIIQFKIAPSEYDRAWVNGIATAYFNGKDRMNGETGITASGYDLDNGIHYMGYRVLAGDRSIPLGSLIDIKLYSGQVIHGVILDRGGSINGNRFDIAFNDRAGCLDFGRQTVEWQRVGKIRIN
jgi:3D (Asp-Asp-Asp) domain-containing protein